MVARRADFREASVGRGGVVLVHQPLRDQYPAGCDIAHQMDRWFRSFGNLGSDQDATEFSQ
ncbi:hypothetical protein MBAV_002887 [Candidatus Magnetobacterium bavaricum]|uniref:Uncharacterized protein n=1 Tax=Candidatus Magnetobacterium bavaricum TaxID=29290 RepID=A0A0F3GW84_9BACT|nr:hypothetical protein MBAV_002887 [Candidatus Magnetobacterium bavaricum]